MFIDSSHSHSLKLLYVWETWRRVRDILIFCFPDKVSRRIHGKRINNRGQGCCSVDTLRRRLYNKNTSYNWRGGKGIITKTHRSRRADELFRLESPNNATTTFWECRVIFKVTVFKRGDRMLAIFLFEILIQHSNKFFFHFFFSK